MDDPNRTTPGPYGLRPAPGVNDVEIYAESTGESLAVVLSGKRRREAPEDETALRNAALFRAAPELRDCLQKMAGEEQSRPETAAAARALLAAIAVGPGERFLEAREKERRDFEESIAAQMLEMCSARQPNRWDSPELDEEEDPGQSSRGGACRLVVGSARRHKGRARILRGIE